jgi:hypothetical protein
MDLKQVIQRGQVLSGIKLLYSPMKTLKNIVDEPTIMGFVFIIILFSFGSTALDGIMYSKIAIEEPFLETVPIPSGEPPYKVTSGFRNLEMPSRLNVITYNWTGNLLIKGTNNSNGVSEEINISNDDVYTTAKLFGVVNEVVFDAAGNNETSFIAIGIQGVYSPILTEFPELYGVMFYRLISNLSNLFINWVVSSGILLLFIRILHTDIGSLRRVFFSLGYTFSVFLVSLLLNILLYLSLPVLNLPFRIWASPQTESILLQQIMANRWYSLLSFQIFSYLPFAVETWRVFLCAIIVYYLYSYSWQKAVIVSIFASIVAFFLRILL